MDTGLIILAVAARAAVLWAFDHLLPQAHDGGEPDWAIAALEWIAGCGMVGTAAIYTFFDLWGAIRDKVAELKSGT